LLRPFIVIGFVSGATAAFADPVPLANDELKTTVSGSIVEIDTPLGTTVPMRFGTDGLVSAEAGALAPVLGSAKDRGRWWVDGEKLCTKWFRWFDAQVRCLTIARDGNRIAWRKLDDGETGTATLIPAAQPEGPKEKIAKAAAAPTVVAKAEPARAKKKRAALQPVPAPEQEPAQVQEPVPQASVTVAEAPAPQPEPDGIPVPPVRQQEEAATDETVNDETMMRFGGAGLLQASSPASAAVASPGEAAAAEPHKVAAEFVPQEQAPAPVTAADGEDQKIRNALSPLRKEAAPSKPAPKAIVQKRIQTAKVEPPKAKLPVTRADRAMATSSIRSVALYRVRGVKPYDVLNVRRGPSEEHVSIAAIPPSGRSVEITGVCQDQWCPIQYGAVKGWVNRYYLAEEGSRNEASGPMHLARP